MLSKSGACVCGMADRRLRHGFICTIMKWGQESATVLALLPNCACVLMDSGLHYPADPAPRRGLNYKDHQRGSGIPPHGSSMFVTGKNK